MFTFKSGAPVIDFTNSDLWVRGSGYQEADLTAEYRCLGGWSSDPPHRGAHSSPYPTAMSMACGLQQSTPDFIPHLSPDLAPSFFLEECSFWSPSWLSLLKLQLITEYEGWGCLYPPSLLDFPLHLKNYSWRGFETRPLPRVPGKWLSKPESLLNHRHLLATTKAAYSYSCILFFFNLSIFFILYF